MNGKYPSLLALSLWLGVALGTLACPPQVQAAKKDSDEINYLDLAGRLLSDGHLDRAASALTSVNTKSEDTDMHRYHLLSGLIALRQQVFADAATHFRKALKLRPMDEPEEAKEKPYKPDPRLYLYLAQAEFGKGEFQKTLDALNGAGKALLPEAGAHMLASQSYWKLDKRAEAINSLARATKRFPDDPRFQRLQIFYLIEMNLFQEATAIGERYLSRESTKAEDYVAIGEALRRGKQFEKAAIVLEAAHLRFPEDDQLHLALAHAQLELEHHLAAAMVMENAARMDPSYTVQAAEMYRQAKRMERALLLNARVPDQKAKFKQRLAILIDQQEFALVAGMAPTLERLGLVKDDQIRYALAFGFYRLGDRKRATQYLRGIADPKLFENANQLRKAMQACPEDAWDCF